MKESNESSIHYSVDCITEHYHCHQMCRQRWLDSSSHCRCPPIHYHPRMSMTKSMNINRLPVQSYQSFRGSNCYHIEMLRLTTTIGGRRHWIMYTSMDECVARPRFCLLLLLLFSHMCVWPSAGSRSSWSCPFIPSSYLIKYRLDDMSRRSISVRPSK